MNIAVYLGAHSGKSKAFSAAVCELGTWMGSNGHTLVYGGSKSGLMGKIASSVLDSGGKVIGVEPKFNIENDRQFRGLTELIVTDNISLRKQKMAELSRAFIAFPGGTGTLEEITEIMSALCMDMLVAPCILYNLDGYYNDIKNMLAKMIACGFSSEKRQRHIYFAESLKEIEEILKAY